MSGKTFKILLACFLILSLVGPVFSAEKLTPEEKDWLKSAYKTEKNGWHYLHIEGKPFQRGFQHGYLMADQIRECLWTIKFWTYFNYGKQFAFFVEKAKKIYYPKIEAEFIEEMKGIAAGARKAGVRIGFAEILAWNGYEELTDYWWPNAAGKFSELPRADHASAFIAVGSATKNGKIIMAHNTFDDFCTGQFGNLIIDLKPEKGNRILMQSTPGYIDSGTDFFITDSGLIGSETTMGGFSKFDETKAPEFFRSRKAMQYATGIDEFVEIMRAKNNGAYANSWLLGDLKTGEIARFELGLEYYNLVKKKDGYFTGFNAPVDPRIRNLECSDTGFNDIRRHSGARRLRWKQLMKKYAGKIDLKLAKKMISDHYDVYLNQEGPCSRTICAHYELDARQYMSDAGRPEPYCPRGALDAKLVTAYLAGKMSFWARWGNSCGMNFDAGKFLESHPQWDWQKGYLKSRPGKPWTKFQSQKDGIGIPENPAELLVKAGKEFTLTLESNPTTGYKWQLAEPQEENLLKLLGSEYIPPEKSLPGAGGIEIWTFKAAAKGETVIALEYVRPWEKDQAPAKIKKYRILIE